MRFFSVVLVLLLSGCASAMSPQKVEMSPRVENNLQFLYKHLPVEFSVCAYGNVKKGVVHIEKVELPIIYRASDSSVLAEPVSCWEEDILGVIHSHLPEFDCAFSRQDLRTYYQDEYYPSYGLDFLYCNDKLQWQSRKYVPKNLLEFINGPPPPRRSP